MKKILIKIPAMIGMLISALSLYTYGHSAVVELFSKAEENNSSDIWILSVILAVLSLPFFTADGVISIVKAIKKNDTIFNVILAVILLGSSPMVWFVAGNGPIVYHIIWNVYYLVLFVLEIVSIIRIAKAAKKN